MARISNNFGKTKYIYDQKHVKLFSNKNHPN